MASSGKRKADEAELDNAVDYTSWKVTELKEELDNRELLKSGKKADLIERLQTSDAARESGELFESPTAADPDLEETTPSVLQIASSEIAANIGDNADNEVTVSPAMAKGKAKAKKTVPDKTGYAAMTIPKLKEECKMRGISPGGSKVEIIERLEDEDADRAIRAAPDYKDRVDELAIATGEHRAYPFVARPDADQRDRIKKVRKQRMFMMGRKKMVDKNGHPCERFDIAGSSGALYETTIGRVPKCDCIDFKMDNAAGQCKHVLYCTITILRAPDELVCQRAFLSAELRNMFENAPVTQAVSFTIPVTPGVQKPIEGECPICICDFVETDDIVYCKSACGQNIHEECFDTWKKTQERSIGKVTCPYCRSAWVEDDGSNGHFAALKASAPKQGWHKSIAHLDEYQKAMKGSQEQPT